MMLLKNSASKIKLYRFLSTNLSSENDLKTEYLKSTFELFNKSSSLDLLMANNPNLKKLKQASVLIPLTIKIEKNNKKNFVQKMFYTLSKRTETIDSFKGQVCFVGGKKDANDKNAIDTAYREANEEINIQLNQLTYLATLCPLITSNGILITPVVAYFDKSDYKPILNKNEVDLVFELPTERFLSTEGHKSKLLKSGKDEYFVHYFEDIIDGKKIVTWGATAFLCILTSCMIHMRPPSFSIDPQMQLTNDNILHYMDDYLLIKSKNHIDNIANKK